MTLKGLNRLNVAAIELFSVKTIQLLHKFKQASAPFYRKNLGLKTPFFFLPFCFFKSA